MSMYHRRLQILIDDVRYDRIVQASNEHGVSVAAVVREAIDRGLAGQASQRQAAGQRILDAPDMPVPAPAELRKELDAVRGRRG